MSVRWLRRSLFVCLAATGLVSLAGGHVAMGHNRDKTSEPENGSTVVVAPAKVTFWFKSPVGTDAATVFLIDPSGTRTKLTLLDSTDLAVSAALPPLANAAYTVRWKLISTDGHPVTNKIRFTVAVPGQPDFVAPTSSLSTINDASSVATLNAEATSVSAPTVASPGSTLVPTSLAAATLEEPLAPVASVTTSVQAGADASALDDATGRAEVVAAGPAPGDSDEVGGAPNAVRWLLRFASYLCIFMTVGGLAAATLIWPAFRWSRLFRSLIVGGLGGMAVLAFAQLAVLANDLDTSGVASSLWKARSFDAGIGLGARTVLSLAGAAFYLRYDRRSTVIRGAVPGVALSFGLLATWASVGHAKSQRWSAIGIPLDIVHHGAAATWLVGLMVVGSIGLAHVDASRRGALMQRLSTVSLWSVVLVVTTGLLQSVRLVGGLGRMTMAGHSRILVLKLLVVGAMLAVALQNRRATAELTNDDPSGSLPALRRRLLIEVALGVGVLALTTSLVVRSPASSDAAPFNYRSVLSY